MRRFVLLYLLVAVIAVAASACTSAGTLAPRNCPASTDTVNGTGTVVVHAGCVDTIVVTYQPPPAPAR